jgi:hypothetical protein
MTRESENAVKMDHFHVNALSHSCGKVLIGEGGDLPPE